MERNIDGERSIHQLLLIHILTGNLAHNPGMCPDLASNQLPFTLWVDSQPTKLHQLGLWFWFLNFLGFYDINSLGKFPLMLRISLRGLQSSCSPLKTCAPFHPSPVLSPRVTRCWALRIHQRRVGPCADTGGVEVKAPRVAPVLWKLDCELENPVTKEK